MNKEVKTLIKLINEKINKFGIPDYKKQWNKIPIPNNIHSRQNLLDFLNHYVKSYHSHSFVIDNITKKPIIEAKKWLLSK